MFVDYTTGVCLHLCPIYEISVNIKPSPSCHVYNLCTVSKIFRKQKDPSPSWREVAFTVYNVQSALRFIGETCGQFAIRIREHLDITRDNPTSALAEHIKITAYSLNAEDFVILHFGGARRKRLVLDEFEIIRHSQNENYIVVKRLLPEEESLLLRGYLSHHSMIRPDFSWSRADLPNFCMIHFCTRVLF